MRLKELRKMRKWKQNDVAQILSCSQSVYSRYESGVRQPSLDIIKKLADIYDVSVDYLMGYNSSSVSVFESKTELYGEKQSVTKDTSVNNVYVQIMKELEGTDMELATEVLNFLRFKKLYKKE